MTTQYERILAFLRKNKQGTVLQLMKASGSNYISRRLYEMTTGSGFVHMVHTKKSVLDERITRHWTTTRDGKRVRLYRLERMR